MPNATLNHRGQSVLSGLTATGASQATAYQLLNDCDHEFTAVASSTGAVLPMARLASAVRAWNGGASTLSVYPPVGGTVDGASVNAPFSVSASAGAQFFAADLLTWYSTSSGSAPSYSAPAFTAFAITGVSSPVEVGATVSGTKTFTWATSNSGNVQANTIAIEDTTTTTILGSGLANNGSAALAAGTVTHNVATNETWSITGTNTHSATFTDTFVVSWLWRVYVGTASTAELTAAEIQALTDSDGLQAGFGGTYQCSASNYKYLCYPDALGSASNFVDGNTTFPMSMATVSDDAAYSNTANGYSYAIVSVTNANSITTNYRVYRSQFPLSSATKMVVS